MAPKLKTKTSKRSRGSALLEKAVAGFGSYEKATASLNAATERKYLRASVWHWATGRHKPSRAAAQDLEKWKKTLDPRAWDE